MSDYYDDEFNFRYGATRRVKGGIRARTTRGAFGNNWWAARWIAVLESFSIGGRLARGKAYARTGQVLDLEIGEGLVKASVQGSQRHPYRVEVRVKTIPPQKWVVLAQTSLRQIVIASKLLAGQMPENIEQLISQAGASLFPTRADDLKTECSCPDYSNPCKHIAAVYYLIGEEFDRDPFLLFKLRGMTKDTLLDLILVDKEEPEREQPGRDEPRAKAPKAKDAKKKEPKAKEPSSLPKPERGAKKPPAADSAGAPTHPDPAAAPIKDELPAEARDFWTVPSLADDLIGSVSTPTHPATLLKRLGPLPFWRSEENLFDTLAPLYALASERALQILGHDSGDDSN